MGLNSNNVTVSKQNDNRALTDTTSAAILGLGAGVLLGSY